MTTYTVEWSIEVDADDPVDAAIQCLGMHRDPDSTATVFVVRGPNTKPVVVDVEDVNQPVFMRSVQ